MRVKSIGWRTDLALRELEGAKIVEGEDHVVVRTPENRAYRWGNFMLFARAPRPGDGQRWLEQFAAEFPDTDYVAIGIDGPAAGAEALEELVALGLRVAVETVLRTTQLKAPVSEPAAAEYRRVEGDSDWRQAADLSLASDESEDSQRHREYLERRMGTIRRVCEDGRGAWFGAFRGGEMHAGLGVFDAGSGYARFQAVDTHPAHRRQGLATHLLHAAGSYALGQLGTKTLVIAADPEYHAIRIYRSLGFSDHGRQTQLERLDVNRAARYPPC